MFYSHLDSLCAERGITITELMKELKISPSSASRWKSKGYEPSRATAKKIADYFGITVQQLMNSEKEIVPAPKSEDDEMTELLETIRRRPDLKILFSLSKNATPEDVKKAIKFIQTFCGDEDE